MLRTVKRVSFSPEESDLKENWRLLRPDEQPTPEEAENILLGRNTEELVAALREQYPCTHPEAAFVTLDGHGNAEGTTEGELDSFFDLTRLDVYHVPVMLDDDAEAAQAAGVAASYGKVLVSPRWAQQNLEEFIDNELRRVVRDNTEQGVDYDYHYGATNRYCGHLAVKPMLPRRRVMLEFLPGQKVKRKQRSEASKKQAEQRRQWRKANRLADCQLQSWDARAAVSDTLRAVFKMLVGRLKDPEARSAVLAMVAVSGYDPDTVVNALGPAWELYDKLSRKAGAHRKTSHFKELMDKAKPYLERRSDVPWEGKLLEILRKEAKAWKPKGYTATASKRRRVATAAAAVPAGA